MTRMLVICLLALACIASAADFTMYHDAHPSKERSSTPIEGPYYIPLDSSQANVQAAYSWIGQQLNTMSSYIINYPYSFTSTKLNMTFPHGAIISFTQPGSGTWFGDTNNIDISRGQALYAKSFGILSLTVQSGSATTFLTPEASDFCPLTTTWANFYYRFSRCFTSYTYQQYSQNNWVPESASVFLVNETDLQTGFLFNADGSNRLSAFIFPDIYQGAQDQIVTLIGTAGVAAIKTWVAQGGSLITSGKGVLVAQSMGLIASGTFDTSNTFVAKNRTNGVTGANYCNNAFTSTTNDPTSFVEAALCNVQTSMSYLESAPMLASQNQMTTVNTYDLSGSESLNIISADGTFTPVTANANPSSFPFQMYTTAGTGEGQIIVNLGNQVQSSGEYPWIMNALFLSWGQPLILRGAIELTNPKWVHIPALEQIALLVKVEFYNLYNEQLTSGTMHYWLPNGISVQPTSQYPLPSGCVLAQSPTNTSVAPQPPQGYNNTYLDCSSTFSSGVIPANFQVIHTVPIYIENILVTQQLNNCPMLYPIATYVVPSRNNLPVTMNYGAVTANAFPAAQLTANTNVEPLGPYPLPGSGTLTDNIPYIISSVNAKATEVQMLLQMPLVVPLVGMSDQSQLLYSIEFDNDYYTKATNAYLDYVYPFTIYEPESARQTDYIDLVVTTARGNIFASDYDEPVKGSTQPRSVAQFGKYNIETLPGSSQAGNFYPTTTNEQVILEQYYPDALNFWDSAAPRQSMYLDPTSPGASYNAWATSSRFLGKGVPSWMMANNQQAMATPIVFVRSDIYFETIDTALAIPAGVPYGSVLTVDKHASNNACGQNGSYYIDGVYDSTYQGAALANGNFDYSSPPGLKAAEWYNPVTQNCAYWNNMITPYSGSTPKGLTWSHYLTRFNNPNIVTGADILDFTASAADPLNVWYFAPSTVEGIARYGDYPNIQAVMAFGGSFPIDPQYSYRGGRMTFTLQGGASFKSADPIGNGYVTFAADKVSITSMSYTAPNIIVVYFKRAQDGDSLGGEPSQMLVNFENINTNNPTITTAFQLEEMYYDLSLPNNTQPQYELYVLHPQCSLTLTMQREVMLSLPSVRMNMQQIRVDPQTGLNTSFVNPLEAFQPYARPHQMVQDIKHRGIWGPGQFSPVLAPSLLTNQGGWEYLVNMGVSSIPFREFVTTGISQNIPCLDITGQVQWQDEWGRSWATPLRTVYQVVGPLPGPVDDFWMSTTYEMLVPGQNIRRQIWQSDESIIVHAQMKFSNAYQKFFNAPACYDNMQVSALSGAAISASTPSSPPQALYFGNSYIYGQCYQEGRLVLDGAEIPMSIRPQIQSAMLCATNSTTIDNACKGIGAGLPTWDARPLGNTQEPYNFVQQVYDYYPAGYITDGMWSLTDPNYMTGLFGFGYPWHWDNVLPSIDNSNPKPQNALLYPIFAGAGYAMTYTASQTHPNFPGKQAWWSDNLQNRDFTLLAGQPTSNAVSVGAADQTAQVGWVPISTIAGFNPASLNNVYVCEYGQYRINTTYSNPFISYSNNVAFHNVLPIDFTLKTNDTRYYNYNCTSTPQTWNTYNMPTGINNYLLTNTEFNYLYFTLNLRGEAKENLNVLYTASPVNGYEQEGLTVVQEGGTWSYWNPALGPNDYEIVTDVPQAVMARRTDVSLYTELYPTNAISTQASTLITHIHVEDTNEINRMWDDTIYENNYGFGDASVNVYVGQAGTSVFVPPGGTTMALIEFVNNCGFDWNLYGGAITYTTSGPGSAWLVPAPTVNSTTLLSTVLHSVPVPLQYNFMTFTPTPALAPYVTITPSNYYANVASMSADFSNRNVATIKDGYLGDYYIYIHVADNIPSELLGRLYNISVTLNTQYFDQLPGPTDPTGIHNYELAIPDIVIAIPDANGNAYYTSGFSYQQLITMPINPMLTPLDIKFIPASYIANLSAVVANLEGQAPRIAQWWNNMTKVDNQTAKWWFNDTTDVNGNAVRTVYIQPNGTHSDPFPWATPSGPYIAAYDLLVLYEPNAVPSGLMSVDQSTTITYLDDVSKPKSYSAGGHTTTAVGPYLVIAYNGTIHSAQGALIVPGGLQYNDNGLAQITFTLTNAGSDIAYNTNATLILASGVHFQSTNAGITSVISEQNVTLMTGFDIAVGATLKVNFIVSFDPLPAADAAFAQRLFVADAAAAGYTDVSYQQPFSQYLPQPLLFPLGKVPAVILSLSKDGATHADLSLANSQLLAWLKTSTYASQIGNIDYIWYREDTNFKTSKQPENVFYPIANTTQLTDEDNISDGVGWFTAPVVNYQVIVMLTGAQVTRSNVVQYKRGNSAWIIAAIILPIVAFLALLALAAALIHKRRKNMPARPKPVKTQKLKDLSEPARPAASTPKAVAAASPNPADAGADFAKPKEFTVNIDYLMTGAKRVRVKDGNPTAIVPPTEDDYQPDSDPSSPDSHMGKYGGEDGDLRTPKLPWYKRMFPCFPF